MTMKNEFNKTESLLQSGQQMKMSESEKKDMFATLEAYADFYSPTPAVQEQTSRSWLSFSYPKFVIAGLAFVVITGTGTTLGAQQSLPGQFFYPVKTDVLEPAVGLFHFTELDKLTHQVELSQERFFEMEELVKIQKLTPETMQIIESKTNNHLMNVSEMMSQIESSQESLAAISDLVSIMQAQEFTESKYLNPETDTTTTDLNTLSAQQLYANELDEVSANQEEVTDYIEDTLVKIDTVIEQETTETTEIQIELADYLEDVSQALQDSDYQAAANFSSEAEQLIEFTEYTQEEAASN